MLVVRLHCVALTAVAVTVTSAVAVPAATNVAATLKNAVRTRKRGAPDRQMSLERESVKDRRFHLHKRPGQSISDFWRPRLRLAYSRSNDIAPLSSGNCTRRALPQLPRHTLAPGAPCPPPRQSKTAPPEVVARFAQLEALWLWLQLRLKFKLWFKLKPCRQH